MKMDLISSGDSEPHAVPMAPNGDVFWTCSSVGVIKEARPEFRFFNDND